MRKNYAAEERHGMWAGGKTVASGYVQVRAVGHPRATKSGHYVFEHILIVERALGHYLPLNAVVHHGDENKQNNANGNLVACEGRKYHNILHRRLRALQACGDATAHQCAHCHRYDNQHDITVANLKSGEFFAYHRACNAEYQRRRKMRLAQEAA